MLVRKGLVDPGRLRSSIHGQVRPVGVADFEGVVSTNVEYAPHVEFGTVYQRPRGMFARGIAEKRNKIRALLKQARNEIVERLTRGF